MTFLSILGTFIMNMVIICSILAYSEFANSNNYYLKKAELTNKQTTTKQKHYDSPISFN